MTAVTLSKVRRPPCSDPLRHTRRPSRTPPRQSVRQPCGEGAAPPPLYYVTRARPWGPPRPARKVYAVLRPLIEALDGS